MGWSQNLNGSDKISDKEVDEILDFIKAGHWAGEWCRSRQEWGWSTECDISRRSWNPEDKNLYFSGAWFSFGTDLPERFMAAAQSRGHPVSLGPRHG